jgi:hypothetical protein
VFAQKLRLTLEAGGVRTPVPKAWLDQFFMRNFTGSSAFDETLAAGDGELEAGLGVDPGEVQAQFGTWLKGRRMIGPDVQLVIERQSL